MRKRKHDLARMLVVSLAVFAVLIGGGMALIRGIETASGNAQTQLVQDAVRRAVVTCYAVEGAYPTGLDYLVKNYGLIYDDDHYFVIYDAFASNILPEIRVIEKGAAL